jgi:hypothetical protein
VRTLSSRYAPPIFHANSCEMRRDIFTPLPTCPMPQAKPIGTTAFFH